MKVLQLAGHFAKWNLDARYQNDIGEGFVFCAYSFANGFFDPPRVNGYNTASVLENSFFDLQYFAKKEAANISKGKLGTYDFHPSSSKTDETHTNVIEGLIKKGIK